MGCELLEESRRRTRCTMKGPGGDFYWSFFLREEILNICVQSGGVINHLVCASQRRLLEKCSRSMCGCCTLPGSDGCGVIGVGEVTVELDQQISSPDSSPSEFRWVVIASSTNFWSSRRCSVWCRDSRGEGRGCTSVKIFKSKVIVKLTNGPLNVNN